MFARIGSNNVFPPQFIDPAFNIGNAWKRLIEQGERRMKPECNKRRWVFKIFLISLMITFAVFRTWVSNYASLVLRNVLLFALGATLDGYATLWCHINNNSALNCEVHMQTHRPSTIQCGVNLGTDTYNFCGA